MVASRNRASSVVSCARNESAHTTTSNAEMRLLLRSILRVQFLEVLENQAAIRWGQILELLSGRRCVLVVVVEQTRPQCANHSRRQLVGAFRLPLLADFVTLHRT